ncbi:cation:proton antiporter [Geminocystis sp. GBBB08]|uniref:cation:proton antiporter n=1 Tax=Geminocystis sp. GBBB08 TaxID=2604140 RepID=UPI0027E32868|nr:cation:proton antiporter [Geminocystis sp. GBBB08]MBL1210863.1 sodium:proton antiporter [Geminocystis sp. GBBB08]
MFSSLIWVLLMGFFGGQIARRLKLPPLVGMIIIGIILSPNVGNILSTEMLASASGFRVVAVMVILMKAGLGLDAEKLSKQTTVALRLGFLPAGVEAIVTALASMWLLKFNFSTGLLLGCIIGAESPAVIVPGMLRLKSLGWGVEKGIADAILTGSALSNVLLLLVFSLLLAFLGNTSDGITLLGIKITPLQLLPFQVLMQILLGIVFGWLTAKILVSLLRQQNWTQNATQDAIITVTIALLLVVLAEKYPFFSGYLAVMAVGFFLIKFDAPLARRLRNGFDHLWIVAEIILFVLLGASIQLDVLGNYLILGVILLIIGTFIGRGIGWYLSTLGSNWTWKERLFLLPGNSAKATVQAAIGGIPLALGIKGGDTMLAIAVLSILITAPLGAWAIPTFAPKLLEKGEVDPTKITLNQDIVLLAAIPADSSLISILLKTAEIARRSDAKVIVLHVTEEENPIFKQEIESKTNQILKDINHQLIMTSGVVTEEILRITKEYKISEIILGKRNIPPLDKLLVSSISQGVLENSPLPIILVNT